MWSNEYQKMNELAFNLGDKTSVGRVHLIVPTKFHEIVKRMAWSLDAVPYFPTEDKLLELFKSGYMKAAGNKYKHIAELVMERYPG